MSVGNGAWLRDRYEKLETIGRGGQGEVIKALDHLHGRSVAIKIREVTGPEDRDVLLEEARVLLDLEPHPGFPVVRDDFFEGDRYYLVMDWVAGTDLATLLRQRGDPGLPYAIVLRYLEQVAVTLDHLHSHTPPVVHQDVKPANLILTPKGRVVLVDFGIAGSLTRDVVMGTPDYVAPELLAGDPPTPATDIFGLAATTYALLTGTPPRGDTAEWEDIPRENIRTVEHALGRGLAVDPARRPGSAQELVERLRARLVAPRSDAADVDETGRTVPLPRRRPARRSRLVPALAIALVVIAAVVTAIVIRSSPPAVARVPDDSVALIDPDGGTVFDSVHVGRMPTSIVAVEDSIWVANLKNETVSHIDAETGEVVGTINAGGAPTDISEGAGSIWVANSLDGSIVRIDRDTEELTATLHVPVATKSVAAADDAVWVANSFDNTLTRIDPRTNSVVPPALQLPGSPADIALGFGSVWVTTPVGDRLFRVDAASSEVTSIALRGTPDQIAVGDDALWISSPESNQVFKVDPDARTATGIEVGTSPTGVAVSGDDVWVANYLDGTVTRIDGSEGRVVDTIRVGTAAEGIAVDESGSVWVTVHAR